MYKVAFFDQTGARKGSICFEAKGLPVRPNKAFIHQVVTLYLNNLRKGTAHTKGRGDVEGSTKKPWRQKGLGRARAGTIRSPIWRHGGVVFGPRSRDRRKNIPEKMRRGALQHVLAGKLKDEEISVIESIEFKAPKTRDAHKILETAGLSKRTLVVPGTYDRNLHMSVRNIENADVLPLAQLNALSALSYRNILLTLDSFEKLFSVKKGDYKVEVE